MHYPEIEVSRRPMRMRSSGVRYALQYTTPLLTICQVDQTTLLALLPAELLPVFNELGLAGRRLLGSTSAKLYAIYNKYYYEPQIVVHVIEAISSAENPSRAFRSRAVGTELYQCCLSK